METIVPIPMISNKNTHGTQVNIWALLQIRFGEKHVHIIVKPTEYLKTVDFEECYFFI